MSKILRVAPRKSSKAGIKKVARSTRAIKKILPKVAAKKTATKATPKKVARSTEKRNEKYASEELTELTETSWYDDEDTDDGDYQVKEYDITASPNDFNITTMHNFIESGAVVIPGFQRNYVWDIKRASKLIESIIIGLPIPQIFLYEENRNKFLVIDGQQRLMSIYYFMKQRFPRKEKRVEIRQLFDKHGSIPDKILQNDDYFTKFNLQLVEQLPNRPNRLNGLNYSTLGEYKGSFDFRTVRNIIIKQNLPNEDDSSIYEIFNRLNSGGLNLKPQEIRTSLYHSDFYAMLYRVNSDRRWRKLLGVAQTDLHMKDLEVLLRGFAMLVEGHNYKPSMTKFLNDYSRKCKELGQTKINYLEKLFISFLDACGDLPARAFYGKMTNKFNISVFEAVFSAFCASPFQQKKLVTARIQPSKLQRLKDDPAFVEATQKELASKANVSKRLNRAKAILL